MKDKIKSLIKGIIFVVVFLFCLINVQNVLADKDSGKDYQKMYGFFEERKNSLDAVFLGASSTYAFWNPAVAWKEKGIAVYSLTNSSQPTEIAHYLIDDARKKQPDALYIINITRWLEEDEYSNVRIHRFLGSYPASLNKYKALTYMCNLSDKPLSDRMELYFSIIQFHERWDELTLMDFGGVEDTYKSASAYDSYLKKKRKQEPAVVDYLAYEGLTDSMRTALNDIMNYCDRENVKVLFVIMPQALEDSPRVNRPNTVTRVLEENGFTVLDLRKKVEEMGLDYKKHFYDEKHTNIHGSIIVTDYISDYLIENYGFTDKRGTPGYGDWDKECTDYYNLIAEYLTPEEKAAMSFQQ